MLGRRGRSALQGAEGAGLVLLWGVALAAQVQAPALYEVHCVSRAGETVFFDTLPAGTYRWGELSVVKAEDVAAPMGPALVVQYPGGRLTSLQCDRVPTVKPIPMHGAADTGTRR